jgi:hypothetical protein
MELFATNLLSKLFNRGLGTGVGPGGTTDTNLIPFFNV